MTFFALSSLGVGLVIFSELSATVMIGGVLVIGIFGQFNLYIYISYLIVLIEAVFAFIEKVVVIMVICVIGALTLYMGLLMLLDSWFRRGRTTTLGGAGNSRWNYQEQTNEVSTDSGI